MDTYRITFLKEDTVCQACKGTTVLEAAREAGLVQDAFCGGKGKCGKCKVNIDGTECLACQTVIDRDMTVQTEWSTSEKAQILMKGTGRKVIFDPGKLPGNLEHPLIGAVDVGSTSIVVYLMDGRSGEQIGVRSSLNPQRQYGADVVSRCSYALERGEEALSSCVRRTVNELFLELAQQCGRTVEEIVRIVMVGNSCMHHLFLGISTETLALAPYMPKVTEALALRAADYDLHAHPDAELWWLPNIGGFVGADTVGCLVAADLETCEEMTLLLDIGTNGELVLGNREGLLCCATAAGPAFEGAKITCGMRGCAGAIDKVYIEDGEIRYHVIEECEPIGICGSGLLDAAACFLELGIMEDSGRLKETYYFTDKVFLNQKDIRELQLAKAAIAAGIEILCERRGVRPEQIDRLLIAGAFGNYLDPASACAIGMLPPALEGRIRSIGNAAGEGAQIAALSSAEFERSTRLAGQTGFLELATDPGFQDVYVDMLEFPEQEEE